MELCGQLHGVRHAVACGEAHTEGNTRSGVPLGTAGAIARRVFVVHDAGSGGGLRSVLETGGQGRLKGAWLDIWWVSEHWVPAGKAKLKRKPTHPDDAPNVRIFLNYGDTLIFRHDLWHGGVGYDHDNYRLFCYFNSEDKEVEIDDDSEGETYPAECPCKNARRCTCKPRTSAAKEVLDEGKPKWVKVCFPAPPPR